MDIRTELGRRILFCDGAMGTMLQAAGLPAGREPELWNLERPEVVRALHGQYLAAGADIIATNTFGANGVKLSGHPLEEIVAAAVRLAREAVEEAGRGWVALDVGPTGRLLQPMGDLPFEAAVEAYAREIRAGVQAGADLVFLETMSDLYEAKAAVVAAKENSDLPIFVTLVLDEKGRLLTGGDIPSAVTLLEGLRVDALGLNCGLGPDQMAELLPTLRAYTRLPIILNPNAGLPECVDGCTRFGVGPEAFSADLAGLAILARRIEDQAGNWTRFVIIGPQAARAQLGGAMRTPVPGHTGADKTSLLFTLPDKSGALSAVLDLLARHQINMRKLESRPLRGQCWKYVFFADVESDLEAPQYAELLQKLHETCTSFRILGCYPTGPQLDRPENNKDDDHA